MTSEETPDRIPKAFGSYGDLFQPEPEPDSETSGPPRSVPDESEAAMTRLRAPFDVGPVKAVEHRT
ncbi:hypothetical protein [Micromonospora sp. CPCC 206061]|uniref:hypothetical protein n=1 Tax=Micromonospora sp. CPCC 206061 TaxID=3122410 RepID=UPI002FF3E95F